MTHDRDDTRLEYALYQLIIRGAVSIDRVGAPGYWTYAVYSWRCSTTWDAVGKGSSMRIAAERCLKEIMDGGKK